MSRSVIKSAVGALSRLVTGPVIGSVARRRGVLILACFGVLTVFAVFAAAREPQPPASAAAPRVSAERSGALATRDGLQLTLTADTGSVHVFTDAPASATNRAGATGELRYAVHIEAAAGDEAATLLKEFSLAARGTPRGVVLAGRMPKPRDAERVWVIYEVHVPRQYSLEISTRAGDITIQDVDGTVTLSTGGGNIEAGRIGSSAVVTGVHEAGKHEKAQRFVGRLDTAGGHITVGDVSGGLRATTGGGHISAGNIDGDAVLHTAGGDVHAGRLAGFAQLITGGGNIVAQSAVGGVEAESAGGRIELGEAAGADPAGMHGRQEAEQHRAVPGRPHADRLARWRYGFCGFAVRMRLCCLGLWPAALRRGWHQTSGTLVECTQIYTTQCRPSQTLQRIHAT